MWESSELYLAARQQFQIWRENKASGEKIPEKLWDMVAQILEHPECKKVAVTRGLGISTSQLKTRFPQYFKRTKKTNSSTVRKPKFVEAPLVPITSILDDKSTISILHKNGAKLSISAPTTEQFNSLIKLFTE